ncbi:MAG: hypothetical protein HOB73_11450 [Planctomycetaceae bacterium]|nr:hypothetical protein [Planctomycetaceae bacterium]
MTVNKEHSQANNEAGNFFKILHASCNRLSLQLLDHQVRNLTRQNQYQIKAIPRQANDNNFSILATTIYSQVFSTFSETIVDYATQICAPRFFSRDNLLVFNG